MWLAYSDPEDNLSLDKLSVRGNHIDSTWAKRLNRKLSCPLKVKNLDLSENDIGDDAAKSIMVYFSDNAHIEVLDLSSNNFTREGLRHLKELPWYNPCIKELIVKGNKDIDDSVEMCERRMRSSETKQKIIYY